MVIDILTVYGQYNPFKEIQKRNLERYTESTYKHYTMQGGTKGSYSHGKALDELMEQGDGEYVMTLDADAFPVNDYGWDTSLINRLTGLSAVGIWHPRPFYIHPSCFMARRKDLEGLSWQRSGDKDVGRVISEAMERRDGVSIMMPTSYYAKNPTGDYEPPIGAVYDDIVFHNWYTSRTRQTTNPDGISNKLIEDSIAEALSRYG